MSSSNRPHLVILNQMAGPLTWEFAEDLANDGWSVTLLTGHPDTLAKGSQGNLSIHRSFRYRRGNMLRRSVCWLSYLAHAFLWLWRWPAKTPLLVFSNPPMLVWLAAVIKKLRGTRFVVMVHDIYPELVVRMGTLREGGLVTRVWRRLNRWAYNHAEEVLTLGECMAEALSQELDADSTRSGAVQIVYPWADTDRIRPIEKQDNPFAVEHELTGKLTILYSGNMGLGHDLESMLAASRLIEDDRAHFLFIGSGPKWHVIKQTIEQTDHPNVTLMPWLHESQIPHSLATADIAMVSLEPEISGLAIPSKAFYSLAAGTPLIVLSEAQSELATLVQNHECGWLVAPGDAARIAEIVTEMLASPKMLDRFKQNARATAKSIGARNRNSIAFREVVQQTLFPANYSASLAGR